MAQMSQTEEKTIIEETKIHSNEMLSILLSLNLTQNELWNDNEEIGYRTYFRYLSSLHDHLRYTTEEIKEIKENMMKEHFIETILNYKKINRRTSNFDTVLI
jgi:hypothetical protein